MRIRAGIAFVLAALGLVDPAPAQDSVETFYQGRVVNLIVGYGPGGGYDTVGRLVARHLGRYIPGNPKIVVQNLPGAGSMRAVSYLHSVAPKDGPAIGMLGRDVPLICLIGDASQVPSAPA